MLWKGVDCQRDAPFPWESPQAKALQDRFPLPVGNRLKRILGFPKATFVENEVVEKKRPGVQPGRRGSRDLGAHGALPCQPQLKPPAPQDDLGCPQGATPAPEPEPPETCTAGTDMSFSAFSELQEGHGGIGALMEKTSFS